MNLSMYTYPSTFVITPTPYKSTAAHIIFLILIIIIRLPVYDITFKKDLQSKYSHFPRLFSKTITCSR